MASKGSQHTPPSLDSVCRQLCERVYSGMYKQLLALFNLVKTAMLAGDVTNALAGTITLRNSVDGTSHFAQGVGIPRLPPKTYAAQGGHVSWPMPCADIQTISL